MDFKEIQPFLSAAGNNGSQLLASLAAVDVFHKVTAGLAKIGVTEPCAAELTSMVHHFKQRNITNATWVAGCDMLSLAISAAVVVGKFKAKFNVTEKLTL